MCCGNIPRLCECGCSEYDHDEPAIEDKAFYVHFGGTQPSRGKCNGQHLAGLIEGHIPDFQPCPCQKFKDIFEPSRSLCSPT